MVDAGFASLATFAAGLTAIILFSDSDRGIYAVFFTAFNLGAILVYQLVYVPAEIVAVSRSLRDRLSILDDSLRIGRLPALGGCVAILAATAATAPISDAGLSVGLTLTAVVATFLSPTQDHLRRTLHIAHLPWYAAATSMVQFVVTGAALGVMVLLDVPTAWIPFGSLAIANTVSLSFSLAIIRSRRREIAIPDRVTFRDLSLQGRWLLAQAVIPALAAFITANIITYLASPEAMGFAEAARVVAQPILVAASGLTSALRPRVMEAAMVRDHDVSRRVETLYVGLVLGAAVILTPIVGLGSWAWNPMVRLVPAAYEVKYLVIASIWASALMGAQFLTVNEMMAAGRARGLTVLEAAATPLRLLAAASAAVVGAFALPVSTVVNGLMVLVGLVYMYRQLYGLGRRRRRGLLASSNRTPTPK
jgi:O-antigen/teichoic acid export membrane protein